MSNGFIRFWGVRGSYAAPHKSHLGVGGNTSCVEVRSGESLVVFDGGTGIIDLGTHLLSEDARREITILFTHYHWDHICGMPFFTPAFHPDWVVRFFGPGKSSADIEQCLADQMKAPYFPVETETWQADTQYLDPKADGIEIGELTARYFHVHHPGLTYGYRVEVAGKDVVYVSDNEFNFLRQSIADRIDEFDSRDHDLLEQMQIEERQRELDPLRGADILIHDAQYTPQDYEKKRGWGHSCYVDTVNAAIDAEVGCLYLYHHDPHYDDTQVERIHAHALEIITDRNSQMACHIAREGLVVDL